jgi:hypothetical protein
VHAFLTKQQRQSKRSQILAPTMLPRHFRQLSARPLARFAAVPRVPRRGVHALPTGELLT